MVCGDAQAGAAAGGIAAWRPPGMSERDQPSRCCRRLENRKRCAGIQPAALSMASARATKFGAGGGSASADSAGAKTADPRLPALIGRCRRKGFPECLAVDQSRHQERGDHGDAEAQVRQGEVRQQRYGTPAGLAEIAAHADPSFERGIGDGARVETVRRQRTFGMAQWTLMGAVVVRVVELREVVRHGSGEWV